MVRRGLAALTVQTRTSWTAPYKASAWAGGTGLKGQDFDLRTKMVSDGSETYYDRLQRYVAEGGVIDALHGLFTTDAVTDGKVPAGTPSHKGPLVELAREVLSTARQGAYVRLLREEQAILDAHYGALQTERNNKFLYGGGGQGSSSFIPPVPIVGQ